jgi:hypothetical protein
LNFLDGKINTSKVRGAILNQRKTINCKVAHCPGITDEVLTLVLKSPYQKILQQSEHIAWALGNSTNATLISTNSNNEVFSLEIKLDIWENEPIMSSGTIFKGSWGNVPPGETFCCPAPENVNGTICINGSIPGAVLEAEDEVVLYFEKGKVVRWNTKENSKTDVFLKNLRAQAEKKRDLNWNTFAELGIGLNPTIKALTGNALFDEKMAGTIHIAIGDNVVFGHSVSSHTHVDMVVLKPKLILNNRCIIDHGSLDLEQIKIWRSTFSYACLDIKENDRIHFDPSRIKLEGTTIKRRIAKGGRVSLINIISHRFKTTITKIKEDIEGDSGVLVKEMNYKLTKLQRNELKTILEILNHFRAIDIK